MSRLRWHLKTTATHAMGELWQHVKPHGQFVLFGEHSIGFCAPPKPRGRKTPDLIRDYNGQAVALRPEDREQIHILVPFVKKPIAIWPNWALFAVYCVQHQIASVPATPQQAFKQPVSEAEGMWMLSESGWQIVGPTKRNKTTIYCQAGHEETIAGDTHLGPLLDLDCLIPVLWEMLREHTPIINGVVLPERRIPDHVIEAYYEQHPYKKPRAKTPASAE